ncbi:MAG: hypothetical protein JW786_08595 [Desulfobacterales bacterium]|nr:hypothetical protein [Desulfobacterales bacterium]
MNVRKIWGIIFLILGVFLAIGGISDYIDVLALDNSMTSFDNHTSQMFRQAFGTTPPSSLEAMNWNGIVKNSKLTCFFTLICGVFLALLGTFMLRKSSSSGAVHSRCTSHNSLPDKDFDIDI